MSSAKPAVEESFRMDDRAGSWPMTGRVGESDGPGTGWTLDAIVAGLRSSREDTHNIRRGGLIRRMPSRDALIEVIDGLSEALFPSHFSRTDVKDTNIDGVVRTALDRVLDRLVEQVRRELAMTRAATTDSRPDDAASITRDFAACLPQIRGLLVSDLRAALDGDPAASNMPEILLGYPGMQAIIGHRLAHALHGLGVPLLARMIAAITHSRTGIDIHPAAAIGPSFFIDHGTGVVIGETAIVGERVRLYQAVTLGARHFPKDEAGAIIKGAPRHPIIEDDVVIYAGATILGRLTIGHGSTIGGNVWLTESVPPGSRVTLLSANRGHAAGSGSRGDNREA